MKLWKYISFRQMFHVSNYVNVIFHVSEYVNVFFHDSNYINLQVAIYLRHHWLELWHKLSFQSHKKIFTGLSLSLVFWYLLKLSLFPLQLLNRTVIVGAGCSDDCWDRFIGFWIEGCLVPVIAAFGIVGRSFFQCSEMFVLVLYFNTRKKTDIVYSRAKDPHIQIK